MPKNKKRRKQSGLQSLEGFNLTGFDAIGQDESLDECMGEFGVKATAQPSSEGALSLSTNQAEKSNIDRHVDKDKIENWNRALISWTQTGNYTCILPSIDEELARHFHVQELSKYLLDQGEDMRMPVFERWLLDARLEDTTSRDPVLPASLHVSSSPACQRLLSEMMQNGIVEQKASSILSELIRQAQTAYQEMTSKFETWQRTSPLKKGDRMDIEDKGKTITLTYSRKKWVKPFHFQINKKHYLRLKEKFFELHNKAETKLDERSGKILRAFHLVVIALLLRYSSLSGGQLLKDLRGGGMQGAVHEVVFNALQETWDGPWVEGFASPFNFYLPVFGSAFPLLDWHFGSIGSFYETNFYQKGGCCCEVNPPFSPGVMTAMVDHIESQIEKANKRSVPITFVVIVPTAGPGKNGIVHKSSSQSFLRMTNSNFCWLHVGLDARNHGYVEGAQHLRATRYKQSSYDTSVIILKSQAANTKTDDKNDIEEKIKAAFASKHEQETKKRKGTDN